MINQEIDPITGMPVEPQVNRAGVPDRSINNLQGINTIQDPGMQSMQQAQAFQKFNNIAQYNPPPTVMLGDLDKDGKMSEYETKRQNAIEKNT
jgi:hypothetical protein